jgi:hypothetical protein
VQGLLREFGVAIPVGANHVVPQIRALFEDTAAPVPMLLQATLGNVCEEIGTLEANTHRIERQLEALARQMPDVVLLQTVPGIGLITATALVALVGDIQRSLTIGPGLVRLDLDDVILPPVVVHVEVPPIADARSDEFAATMVDDKRGPGFKLVRGFRGQFLATYGEHTIRIWTNDRQHLLATKVISVTPAETESRVLLKIPPR